MMTSPPDTPLPPAPAPTPAPVRRRRRWPWLVLVLVLVLALLLALPLGLGLGLWRSTTLTPWALGLLPGLKSQGVRGSAASGRLEVAQLDWTLPGQAGRLQIQGLVLEGLRWQWGATPRLEIHRVSARSVHYHSGPPSATPPSAPSQLRLPLTLAVGELVIDSLQVNAQAPVRQLEARLTLGAQGGWQHRVEQLSATWERAHLQASGQLGGGRELPLSVKARASAPGPRGWQAQLAADGPLAGFALRASAQGEAAPGHPAPALQAEARIEPFARWPLPALNLSTRQLDLSSMSARWPHTALTGQATLAASGPDQPARAELVLDNQQPGRWDDAQLPLRRLLLSVTGTPRKLDELTLQRIELQLADAQADAGLLRGSGRWQRDRLELSLQLDKLQPARLDGRAAAMHLSGPLTLNASNLPWPGTLWAAAPPAAGPSPDAAHPRIALQAQLTGQALTGTGEPVRVSFALEGDSQRWQLRDAQASSGTASASASGQAQLEAAGWRIRLDARMNRFDPLPWWLGEAGSPWRRGGHRLNGEARLQALWHTLPAGDAGAAALARWRRAATGELRATLTDSQLAGVPLAARLMLANDSTTLRWDLAVEAAGNQGQLAGTLAADNRLRDGRLTVGAPALAALAPLRQWLAHGLPAVADWLPAEGGLQAQAQAEGRWPALASRGTLQARALRSPRWQLDQGELRWQFGDAADPPLALQLAARGLVVDGQPLERLDARAEGSLARHTLQLVADSPWRLPPWTESLLGPAGNGTRLDGEGTGRWQRVEGGSLWQLQSFTLRGGAREARTADPVLAAALAPAAEPARASASGPARAADLARAMDLARQGHTPQGSRHWLAASGLVAELSLDAGWRPRALQLAPGRVQLLGTALRWQQARWQAASATAPASLLVDAELERIDVAALLNRLQPAMGWRGDLNIGGRIQLRRADRLDADIVLERSGGDLAVTDSLGHVQPLGLTELRLALGVHDGLWQFAQGLAGQHLGEIAGAQVIRSTPDRLWPAADAPLQGVLEARVAKLGVWGAWVPPGWHLSGSLHTSATLGGRINAPEFSGRMQGSGVGARNLLQGIGVSDGELLITLAGEQARIERFEFRGGDGRLRLGGQATLGAKPAAQLELTAERFRLLGRIDRRLVVSGRAALQLDASRLQLDGQVRVDEGLFDLSRADAPRLDSDVQVHRASAPANGSARPAAAPLPAPLRNAQVAMLIDLGERLRLRGRGIDTGVRGQLRVSSPGGRLALNGTVRTEGGTYEAYGQKLDIERGELTFTGVPDNPRLDVLATRPNLDVVVGVRVIGTAQNPRIRLSSEPEMAEFDKLSWLVLGRSPDGLGRTDTALLQRAAVALLAGGDGTAPSNTLVQALGLTDFSLRQTEGEVRETIVSLGRQLSRRWYVGYERSVNATTGTWQLIYRVAQRLTVRAQSGAENAVDVIWSWRW